MSKTIDEKLPNVAATNMAKMLDPFDKRLDTVAGSMRELKAQVTAMQETQARQHEMFVARDIQRKRDMDTIQELLRNMQGAQADLEAKRSKTHTGAASSESTGRKGTRSSIGESGHGSKRAVVAIIWRIDEVPCGTMTASG